jgi:hypothetical protein
MKNYFLLLLLLSLNTSSQTKYRYAVNNINLPIDNRGVIANVNIFDTDPLINGAGGKFEGHIFLFASGFYISGYVNEQFFSTSISGTPLKDYQPGQVGSNPTDSLNVIHGVKRDDIPFSTRWQKWKDAVLLGADFYDGDKNGIYEPFDKNWNGTWDLNEDMPPLVGDEIAWCIYNDGVPANMKQFKIPPIGIEVHQTLFATNNPELYNTIFIKYKLLNIGLVDETLDSVYFSPWDDTDIGDASDDLGGCDTLLQSVFTYNYGTDLQYGNNPPSVFTTVLQGPIVCSGESADTAFIRNGMPMGEQRFPGFKNEGLYSFTGYTKGAPDQSDAATLTHVLNYIKGRDRLGNKLNSCDTLYGKVYGNVNCNNVNPLFWFSGDPRTKYGWIDKIASDDRKFSSIGPFKLEKNKPIEIILALVVGRGIDELNSISVARENVRNAINEYNSNFASMTYSAKPPTNPVTTYRLYQNYPNPFNPITKIRYEFPNDGIVTIEVFDILGQRVKILLNEYKIADRYEVEFEASNLSSGVYIYTLRAADYFGSRKMLLLK